MKIRILCLDDEIKSLADPFYKVFDRFINKGSLPVFDLPGELDSFTVKGMHNEDIEVEVISNRREMIDETLRQIEKDKSYQEIDIVLLDDNWGPSGRYAGQDILMKPVLDNVTGISNELPVVVLFTQHWEEEERIDKIAQLIKLEGSDNGRIAALSKSDGSGLFLLVQRVISQKKLIMQRDGERKKLDVARKRAKVHGLDIDSVLSGEKSFHGLIGGSVSMLEVYDLVRSVGSTSASILICGESGTGKGVVAHAIHAESKRKGKFAGVNCGAIPENLAESEFFGTEKGAFTGAESTVGWFETADNGTLFLDEIGALTLAMQVKLLRILEEEQFEKVGGKKPIKIDVRIIAATNSNLEKMIEEGKFREDLYHRLNIIDIHMPPLRDRREDIPLLTEHLKDKINKKYSKSIALSQAVVDRLVQSDWASGNVRELNNYLVKAILKCKGSKINIEDLATASTRISNKQKKDISDIKNIDFSHIKGVNIDAMRNYIDACFKAIQKYGANITLDRLDKFIVEELKVGRDGKFKNYLQSHVINFAILIEHNYEMLKPILPVLKRKGKLKSELIARGLCGPE